VTLATTYPQILSKELTSALSFIEGNKDLCVIRYEKGRGGGNTEFAIRLALAYKMIDAAHTPGVIICGYDQDMSTRLAISAQERVNRICGSPRTVRIATPHDVSWRSLSMDCLIIDNTENLNHYQFAALFSRLRDGHHKALVFTGTAGHLMPLITDAAYSSGLNSLPLLNINAGGHYTSNMRKGKDVTP